MFLSRETRRTQVDTALLDRGGMSKNIRLTCHAAALCRKLTIEIVCRSVLAAAAQSIGLDSLLLQSNLLLLLLLLLL